MIKTNPVVLTETEINLIRAAAMILAPLEIRLGSICAAEDGNELSHQIHGIANKLHLIADTGKALPNYHY